MADKMAQAIVTIPRPGPNATHEGNKPHAENTQTPKQPIVA